VIASLKRIIHSMKTHHGFRRHFANISWIFFERILRLFAGLFVGIWVARYLGPTQFGIFSYAVAFAAIFSNFAKLGLDDIVVRDLVREPNRRDIYLGTAFWLKLIGSSVMVCLVGIALQFTANDSTTKLYVLIISSGAIFQAFEVVDFYFQSKVLSKFVSVCKMMQLLISSLVKLYLMFINADLFWFVLVSLVDQVTLAISLYFAYRHQKIGEFFGCFDWVAAKKMLKNSWPLIISGLVVMIYMRIDQIMIKDMLGEKEVGLYSVAVRVCEIWYFIPTIIISSLFPSIVNAKKMSTSLYYFRMQHLYSLMFVLSFSIALIMTFLSDEIILFLYGEAYLEAGQVLMVNIWTGIFVFLGVANARFLLLEGMNKIMLYMTACCSVLNIILNLILIPMHGIIGASIATLLTQGFGLLLNAVYKPTRVGFFMQIKSFMMFNIFRGNSH